MSARRSARRTARSVRRPAPASVDGLPGSLAHRSVGVWTAPEHLHAPRGLLAAWRSATNRYSAARRAWDSRDGAVPAPRSYGVSRTAPDPADLEALRAQAQTLIDAVRTTDNTTPPMGD
ncbi:hypothetical protein [Nocardioides bruguierae]|uniref:Uncharacterized protein n=1 Tax=Nocardioides bruguierae TaxID=2945102 RepID=A0A9X2DBX2_9ACTN|nr:hypothetical protein [Nocardioides bruguierae]MCM0622850.1 hypothetical protein [Nocardioides bruguierae]